MNVLSLFDGMSCGQIALNRIGIKPETYYASEIDKYAIKVTQGNYPDTVQLGDVSAWQEWGIDWASIDLVTGGFPCQAWSTAGLQLGDKDERGKLFWVMLDIMKAVVTHNPRAKFIIENVKMKKEFEQYITHHTELALGRVHKTLINSALVSAQNRRRYYWTNFDVSQPDDNGAKLVDVLESGGVADHGQQAVFMSYNRKQGLGKELDKAYPLNASDYRGLNRNQNQTAVVIGSEYRKLTPIECERLQTVPDNYTNHVSNTQRYKMLGNGWTVDVITHLLKCLDWEG